MPCCRHGNGPAAARAILCRRRRRIFGDRDGMVITLWYPTAPVSLRPDAISDAGAGLRPDWRLLDFDSDAVTGGEECRDAQENKPAPSSEWPPA